MRTKLIGIYAIINKTNNKRYIGCSTDIAYRYASHINALKHNLHYNSKLQIDYNNDPNSFELEIIEECTEKDLRLYETFYISKLKTLEEEFGYNIMFGGRYIKRKKRKPLTQEVKNKISEALKGRRLSDQCYQAMRGCKKIRTKEHQNKIVESAARTRAIKIQNDFSNIIREVVSQS